ncbi:hypothetical protein AKJ48_04330 [candidate division MSBL1 archaeon SCGC-AAA261O19]|uniref:Phosphoribosyltransferase domain-containing protein n=1 Tax=candidate division MSBL1 archaeon SCGC-AAA261O19 TaxID=1698277 RepID=A0A133V9D5_9EURY|nr:hypothetical protein AKJ48_04330 [candidate division MSBL1 archaeon SCGC-AAA261O19]
MVKIRIEELKRELKEKIGKEGKVLGKGFLKVDSFLNHQVDPQLVDRIGMAIAEKYEDKEITKVVTAEAGGNIIAYTTARHLQSLLDSKVLAVYAKKEVPKTMENVMVAKVKSPTKGEVTDLAISGDYLKSGDRVVIADDFLFTGRTSEALTELVENAGATLIGYAFVISKRNFGGYERLRKHDRPIFALVEIVEMDSETGEIYFSE